MRRNAVISLIIGWITAPFAFYAAIGGVVFYVWSVIIAFNESGLLASVATTCFPVIGQLFWMLRLWDLDNHFVFYMFIWCCSAVIGGIGMSYSKKYEERSLAP